MEELMRLADFPGDVVAEVLELRERLMKSKDWGRITDLSGEIMSRLPDSGELKCMLERAERWEEELGIHKYTLDLLVLLDCWARLRTKYQEAGLPEEIFRNSLYDMHCKLMECREVYGVNGIFVGYWYDRFFAMTRFALGRLQFELDTYFLDTPYEKGEKTVKKGDPVINLHIPSSGPLLSEDVDDALNRAAAFYRKYFPEDPVVFVTDSWLVDPDLVRLLPEGNMKEFVHRFTCLKTTKEVKFLDGWRVFGKEWEKDPRRLPRRTKLQRAIGDYLQQGGQLGEGYGIMFW